MLRALQVPAVLDIIVGRTCNLAGLSLPTDETLWLNFCFITSGILAGTILGAAIKPTEYPSTLRRLFALAAVSLGALRWMIGSDERLRSRREATSTGQ